MRNQLSGRRWGAVRISPSAAGTLAVPVTCERTAGCALAETEGHVPTLSFKVWPGEGCLPPGGGGWVPTPVDVSKFLKGRDEL